MLCTANEIKMIKASLVAADELIVKRDAIIREFNSIKRERDRELFKHGPLMFAVRSVFYAFVSFVALELIYVVFPKPFPYYVLAPVFGPIIEYIMKRRASEEIKATTSSIDKRLLDIMERQNEVDTKIFELVLFAEKKLEEYAGDVKDNMIMNTVALDYAIREGDSDIKISLIGRYNDFCNKYKSIDENSSLKKLIDEAQIKANYRYLVFEDIKKEGEKREKNSNNCKD